MAHLSLVCTWRPKSKKCQLNSQIFSKLCLKCADQQRQKRRNSNLIRLFNLFFVRWKASKFDASIAPPIKCLPQQLSQSGSSKEGKLAVTYPHRSLQRHRCRFSWQAGTLCQLLSPFCCFWCAVIVFACASARCRKVSVWKRKVAFVPKVLLLARSIYPDWLNPTQFNF